MAWSKAASGKSQTVLLLERHGFKPDSGPDEQGVLYWRSQNCDVVVSIVNGIFEYVDANNTVRRGSGNKPSLKVLESAILRKDRK